MNGWVRSANPVNSGTVQNAGSLLAPHELLWRGIGTSRLIRLHLGEVALRSPLHVPAIYASV